GMKAPIHIDFSAGSHSPRNSLGSNSAPQPHFMQQRLGQQGATANSRWPSQLYRQWFGAIAEGRSIQVHSILADHPDILDMRRREPTPFHMALTHIASEWLGNDTTGMDGLQVAIMGYKNAYANWRLGNGAQSEQMTGMSADQMKEHVAVREVILGALIDAISPEQLDSHFFGRQQNTTLHLAAFYNDANLVERLLRQGAAIDIPNRMGFLPSGITNDKPTLQWLAMYQGQVRGTRYQSQPSPPQEPQHFYEHDGNDMTSHYADTDNSGSMDPYAEKNAYHQDQDQNPRQNRHDGRASVIESELAVDNIGPFSDDGQVSESSYIKQFADSSRDINPTPNSSEEYEAHNAADDEAFQSEALRYDNQEDDSYGDNVSIASSNDRHSLGLGGIKTSAAKANHEAALLRQRAQNIKPLQLDDARDRASSTGSETAYRRPESPPESPGAMSYHTASGALSEDGLGDKQPQSEETGTYPNIDNTLRIKVDPMSIDDDDIDDIFSDTDDVVQMEPSYCHSGSGLSDSRRQNSEPADKYMSSASSPPKSAPMTMRSLNHAMAQSYQQTNGATNTVISAFPVMIQNSPMPQTIQQSSSKKNPTIDSIKQKEPASKDAAQQQQQNMARPASPFLLRDSLYEMIMGRSPSRTSLTSGYSSHSNTVSNSSTVAVSREHPTFDDVHQSQLPTSPTSPTSMSSQLSPQSTSFEDPNATSGNNTLTNTSGEPVVVLAAEKPQGPQIPEAVDEECSVIITPAESLDEEHPSVPTTGMSSAQQFETAESDISSVSDSEAGAAHANGDLGFDTRSSSPVAAPRPTAASLFNFMQPAPETVAVSENTSSAEESALPQVTFSSSLPKSLALDTQSAPAQDEFPPLAEQAGKPARIGRRQGRATAGLLQDDEGTGFTLQPSFDFVVPKHDSGSSDQKLDSPSSPKPTSDSHTDAAGDAEPDSPSPLSSDMPSLPANVPLTRDKRDQYLQTLINRNTMRGTATNGSPKNKRPAHAAITHAMRAASPARSFSSSNENGSGDDGDVEHEYRHNARSRVGRHVSMRSEGGIDPASFRPPSAHSNRDALAVSGASINGRIRANTMNNGASSPTVAAKPLTPTRKVSPSLATLKTRNLVSNSPAKLATPGSAELSPSADASHNRVLALSSNNSSSSRVRAMSTPAEARAPTLSASTSSTARIGRVAALSQNFERQQASLGPPPKIAIPGRVNSSAGMSNYAGDKTSLGVVSAPLGGFKMDFSKPVARSSSISSSHSTGAHGQTTTASSAHTAAGSSDGTSQQQPGARQEQHSQQSKDQHSLPSDSEESYANDNNNNNGGNNRGDGNGGGDDGSSPSLSVSVVDPTSTDSNGSTTTSHTGSSASHDRGLAANLDQEGGLSAGLLDSRGSADQLGSSIFSSVETPSTSSRDFAPEPSSGLHAPVASRRESEAERKSRFRELANRRKSGTLERISNRGLVKSRKALIDSSGTSVVRSESPLRSSESSASSSSSKPKSKSGNSRVHFADPSPTDDTPENTSQQNVPAESDKAKQQPEQQSEVESFFRQQGEGRSFRDSGATGEPASSAYSNPVASNLDDLQQTHSSALHPESIHNEPDLVASSIGRSGINTDDLLRISAAAQELLSSDVADPLVSRESSSGKSKSGSGSGEESIHILSSLDTLSTPGSTPLDSVQENTHMGLLAQYNVNQKRMDRRYKRESAESEQSFMSSGQESQPTGMESDVDLGFSTISDVNTQTIEARDSSMSGLPEDADESSDAFGTMLPTRQRYDSRALFGLSTVVEEEEDSRNPSMVVGDPVPGPSGTQRSFRPGMHARSRSSSSAEAHSVSSAAAAVAAVTSSAAAVAGASHISSSTSSDALGSAGGQSTEIQERRSANTPLRGLRSALLQGQHPEHSVRQHRSAQALSTTTSLRDSVDVSIESPEPAGLNPEDFESAVPGVGWSTPQADDDTHSHAPSYGSHSFDPNIVFGYTSEENNSTMASRSSFDRSDFFTQNRPGSAASRILYMHPIDQPASEADGGYAGDSESRPQAYPSSPLATGGFSIGGSSRRYVPCDSLSSMRSDGDYYINSSSSEFLGPGKGKMAAYGRPEMQQRPPRAPQTPEHVLTVDEIEEDLTTDEEPIPKILFVESQDFEGYVPIGFQIKQEREERRQERRLQKEAAKLGLPPPEPPKEPKVISPLWFIDNNYVDPLPPDLLQMMIAERDKIEVENMSDHRVTQNPDKKRILESGSISTIRLRQELDDFISEDAGQGTVMKKKAGGSGTIKPLTKKPRVSNISTMFEPPTSPVPVSPVAAEANAYGTRKSFLDSIEIPVSDIESGDSSDDSMDHAPGRFGRFHDDEAFVSPISQEFQVPGHELYRQPTITPTAKVQQQQQQQTPRKRLVLRAKAKTFSEQVLEEVNGLDMHVRTDNQGTVTSYAAGQFAYEPTGTVRPSTIPQYVSPLNGVPAGPFFMPPKATAKSGYLYMRILGIEDIEDRTDSVYFVIRNGIDTLATTPVSVGGQPSTTINQEFRILTDPNVSITMWMRFRSDAIISKGRLAGAMSGWGKGDASCMPPLLRKLVRRNTRSRNRARWNCSTPSDSVFDFDNTAAPGARRDRGAAGFGLAPRPQQPRSQRVAGGYPERVSSALLGQSARAMGDGAFNDPRSLNATQAPSSVFYEPGTERLDQPPSSKGLAQAHFREETRGVAVVHVGEMLDEVFLRGLVDSWDVENVWESRKGARLQLQLFYIPECPLFREDELPKTLSDCEMAMEVCSFHNRTLNSGYMSQRGGDTRFWRRRYFRLIGGFLFAYHEDSKEPRCFIDLNDATRVVDHRQQARMPASPITGFNNADLLRSSNVRRRMTHKRNNSDHSSRDGVPAATGGAVDRGAARHYASGHGYASDSEPADLVDIADPVLQRSSMRRRQRAQHNSARTDSGIVSDLQARDGSMDGGMQHSFSIEFGEGGSIEFYTDSEAEKRVWVEITKRVVGCIPKIPSWLIKLLHADVSDRIDDSSALASGSSLATTASTPSSKFQELTHPLSSHY
ncbi:Bud site selection protein bud4, partial [Coemansia sp. RSA 485]